MPPNPSCSALAAAKDRTGLSYSQIAEKLGSNEQRIIDICTGTTVPSEAEFKALAATLGLTDVPHTDVHKTA